MPPFVSYFFQFRTTWTHLHVWYHAFAQRCNLTILFFASIEYYWIFYSTVMAKMLSNCQAPRDAAKTNFLPAEMDCWECLWLKIQYSPQAKAICHHPGGPIAVLAQRTTVVCCGELRDISHTCSALIGQHPNRYCNVGAPCPHLHCCGPTRCHIAAITFTPSGELQSSFFFISARLTRWNSNIPRRILTYR